MKNTHDITNMYQIANDIIYKDTPLSPLGWSRVNRATCRKFAKDDPELYCTITTRNKLPWFHGDKS